MKGYLHVYTGDGKGKTTAALGLAVRAAGAGLKVYIGQFVKGMDYSEIAAINRYFPQIVIRQFGRDCFIKNKPVREDIDCAKAGLREMQVVLRQGAYNLVIMDEANIATYYGLFSAEELLAVIRDRDTAVEVVVTGRKADPRLIEEADLVSEMREIRHYYAKGIEARKGFEY